MMALTHRQFAVFICLLGCMQLFRTNVFEINYYLSMIIMIQMAKCGALFPDIDHHWKSVKEKTFINWIFNKIIRYTGGVHRSWQTHSWDICIAFTILSFELPKMLAEQGYISGLDAEVASVVLVGFSMGWVSHLFSDMLSHTGVRVLFWNRKSVAFVPKRLFGIEFKTGASWEGFVYRVCRVLNVVVGIFAVMYPFYLNGAVNKLILSLIGG